MSEPTNSTATSSPEQPVEPPKQLGNDGLNGQMMRELQEQLRTDVEAAVRPMLEPPEPPDPRLADLSSEETDLLAERERQYNDDLEQLAFQNQLLTLGQQYPNEVSILQKMLAGESIEDYVAALHEALSEGKEPEQEISDVDRNNPARTAATAQAWQDMIRLPDGQLLTREQGLEILRGAQTLHG